MPKHDPEWQKAKAIVQTCLKHRQPRHISSFLMLTQSEITKKAHRTQKQAAQEVTKQCRAAGLSQEVVDRAARHAARLAGRLYYQIRPQQPAKDPTAGGFFKPPAWQEAQIKKGIAEAKAIRAQ